MSCIDSQGDVLEVMSDRFHVYPYPATAMVRQTEYTFVFKGPYSMVKEMVETFDPQSGRLICSGCPLSTRARNEKFIDHCQCTSPLASDDCTCENNG